jgi:hypothetical protein
MMSTWDDHTAHLEHYKLSFAVNRSRRYHAKMRAFFGACHDAVTASNSIIGGGAFFVLLGDPNDISFVKWLVFIVAVGSALDTAYRFTRRATLHSNLCRRYTELAAKIARLPPTDENLHRAEASLLRIEGDEPPQKRLVNLLAQNEEARARGITDPGQIVPLTRLQEWFGYILTFGMRRVEKWMADHSAF